MAHSDPIADERVGVQVKFRDPLRTRAIPEHFVWGDDSRRSAISSVRTFTFCADMLQPLDLVPLTDFTYKYRPEHNNTSFIKTDKCHPVKVDRMIAADWKCETQNAKHSKTIENISVAITKKTYVDERSLFYSL